MAFIFESKAKTLEKIHNKLKFAKTLPVYRFLVNDYRVDKSIVLKIQSFFDCETIAVRSSAYDEDAFSMSNAGAFESILNVSRNDSVAIEQAIETVLNSYDTVNDKNEIFVQPMLENVHIAGVVFSCDISTLAPYYIINYDESGSTDIITSGKGNSAKTYVHYRYYEYPSRYTDMEKIILAVKEIEQLFYNKIIDVEFAITNNNEIYILQIRPIITNGKKQHFVDLTEGLYRIYKKIEKLQQPHPNLLGKKAIFGVMPDWNPAEIIGIKPKKLALSLYKEMITDNIWAYQRNSYGYRNLCSHPLLVSFMGVPFIDVRVDFNSFIPKALSETIARKLVEYYLEKLYKMPAYHDKVEFEIVHSCFYLDLPEKLDLLKSSGFTAVEIEAIKAALLELTNDIIYPEGQSVYKIDLMKIETLKQKFEDITHSNLAVIDKIYWLLEDCKSYGTLPFAGIARAAFIAVQFLKSFVSLGIITKQEYDAYLNSLNTLPRELNMDLKKLKQDEFLKKWGHLRPGTYDITSQRYDENFDNYFDKGPDSYIDEIKINFSNEQFVAINKNLKKNGLKIDAENLFIFIKSAIENREYSKFVFTKSLSYILLLIEQFGRRFGISRDDAAFIDIKILQDLYSSVSNRDVGTILQDNISFNKNQYTYTQLIKLPTVLINPIDIYGFYIEEDEPNFITLEQIKAEIVLEQDMTNNDIKGKIIFVKSADPGYDYLFTKNIGGLVTQFGGANSHMAIRCAELGIPAVIGAGEKYFNLWGVAHTLEIDCTNRKVKIIS
jgi:phosphohistidine swiveling domain-containing protein